MNDANKDLMVFCLDNYNEVFLKFALRQTIFGANFLVDPKMIDKFLQILE